ncbi:MAG: hypothetical protein P4L73_19280 [Caulobacteraceae bacterium]|nr:hypothetical protein [Caulobacteraceae bacterium]
MANVYTITIKAIDQATAVGRKIGQSLNKLTSPVKDLTRGWKAFNKEAGLSKFAKGVGEVGRSIQKVGGVASRFMPELGALGEIGESAAGIGAAAAGLGALAAGVLAVAGGAAALTLKWAAWGFALKQTSLTLGLSTQALQEWRGAAGMMGIDAQAVDQSFSSLGDTIEDATYGRNQSALAFMNQLGVHLKRTKSGALDVNDAMLQMADVLQQYSGNPALQRLIARKFGVESMLPVLRQGRKATEAYLADAAKTAVPDKDLEDAGRLQKGFNRFGVKLGATLYRLPGLFNRAMAPLGAFKWQALLAPETLPPTFGEAAGQATVKALSGLPGLVSGLMDSVRGLWRNAWSALGREALAEWGVLRGGWDRLWAGMGQAVKSGWGSIKAFFEKMWQDIVAVFKDGADAALGQWNRVADIARKIGHWTAEKGRAAGHAVAQGARAAGGWVAHAGQDVAGAFGIRRNNPGNLRPDSGVGFRSFATIGQGLAAMGRQLQIYQDRHGLSTIAGIVKRWAPPSENNTKAYVAHVAQWSGFAANQSLNLHDPKTLAALEAAMIRQEQGRNPFSQDQLLAALGAAGGAQANGVRAPAAGGGPGHVHVDVSVRHNGHQATARTRATGAVTAGGAKIVRSLDPIAA